MWIVACRTTGPMRYEVTMNNEEGKDKLMDRFKFGHTSVQGKTVVNMVVSFLNLPAYITDEEILAKLEGWGVKAVSTIKRRMWPGMSIADGTRFLNLPDSTPLQDKSTFVPYITDKSEYAVFAFSPDTFSEIAQNSFASHVVDKDIMHVNALVQRTSAKYVLIGWRGACATYPIVK